jgi:hypothetical protein
VISKRGVANTNGSKDLNTITVSAATPTRENLGANASVYTWSGHTTPASPIATRASPQTSNLQTDTTVPKITSGTCKRYYGGPHCDFWLQNKTVFADHRFPQETMHYTIGKMFETLHSADGNATQRCHKMYHEIICRYLLPNCTAELDGQVQRARMCHESCYHLDCKESFYHYLSIFGKQYSSLLELFNPVHLKLTDISCRPELLPRAGDPGISCLVLVESNIFVHTRIHYLYS